MFLSLCGETIGTSTYECHDVDECALQSICDTTRNGSIIQCYGYFSCRQAIKIESTAAATIYCSGSYSCDQTTLIQHIGTSYNKSISCFGLFSCAHVELVYNEYGNLACHDKLSFS